MTCRRNLSRHPDRNAEAADQRPLRDVVHTLERASATRDPEIIARLLTRDVEILIDSGGAVSVVAHGARGRRASATLILQILSRYSCLSLTEQTINGGLGILMKDADVLVGVINVAMRRDAISRIWVVLNPDKLLGVDGC